MDNNNHHNDPSSSMTIVTSIRYEIKKRRLQYQLIAEEIDSVLNGGEGEEEVSSIEDESIPSAHSYPSRRSKRTLQTLKTPLSSSSSAAAAASTPEGVITAFYENSENLHQTSSPSIRTRRKRRRTRTRRPKPFRIKDSEINSYSLFDIMGGSEQRASQQKQHNIYAKTYHPSHLYTPIFVFLSLTFLVLLMIRIIVSLMTITVGRIILVLVFFKILQAFWHRPIQFIKKIHRNPSRSLIGLSIVASLVRHHGQSMIFGLLNQARNILQFDHDRGGFYHSSMNSNILICLVKPSMQGLVYGWIIGRTWLLCLGEESNEKKLTRWFVDRIWKGLIQCSYNKSLRSTQRRLIRLQKLLQEEEEEKQKQRKKYNRECMICLEVFSETSDDPPDLCHEPSRQYLPCLHGFHTHCLKQWLCIKSTCPICRVQLPSTTLCMSTTAVEYSSNYASAHPAIQEPLYIIDED
jgi:hypothetical protein